MDRLRHIFLHRRLRGSRAPLAWLILLALAARACIPIGFMPAADGTLSLKICDDGLPAWLLHHGQGTPDGAGHHPHGDHCLFCNSSTPGPASLPMPMACVVWMAIEILAVTIPAYRHVRLVHIPQARAPPAAV